ncbi:hypothetical protein [Spiroplasma sp. SV19]|uniref:hypothetical protein n=1 Tax=Spiroplasma sp. SV19 TaxID=2570468 RepID=UPI0024B78CBA|nr:hypothetical protein [Spiroplasma sp. SV19]WHQ37457.1 hypothetical protein E7Y35_06385 [Spiroplasma sp. SV19]
MKNFSWKKYLRYLPLALILLTAIVLNLYYIPKYYQEHRKNNSQSTYTVTILGQKEDYSVYFTKGLNVQHAANLADVLVNYPNDFGLSSSTIGTFVKRVGTVELDPKVKYFNIQSGDNNQPDAEHINKDCHGSNNSCNVGIDLLWLTPNTDNVFRFVINNVTNP